MTVRPCGTIVTNQVNYLPYINDKTTPEEFDKEWQIKVGETVPLSSHDCGSHVLCQAATNNNIQLIQHIFKRDASVLNLGDTNGWTPLFYAVRHDKFEAVQLLLSLGADPHLSTIEFVIIEGSFNFLSNSLCIYPGSTCIWAAVHVIHNVAIAKLLIKNGVTQEPEGDTLGIVEHAKKQIAIEQQIALAFDGVLSGSDQQTIADYAFDDVPQLEKAPAVKIGIAFDPCSHLGALRHFLKIDPHKQIEQLLHAAEST